jgi:hypothetical protein
VYPGQFWPHRYDSLIGDYCGYTDGRGFGKQ